MKRTNKEALPTFNPASLSFDIVSFTSKKYNIENITNPVNHCGYCGCKVYTEHQINAIAREMLQSKSERLQGKIKSILEKLEGAKHSDEIALAKRIENIEEIEFYKNFLDISSKKSFLKGEAIFEQVYKKNIDEAIEILTKNMHPLLRTVDHISPQNRNENNNNSDINLVEACYCCNHDLKKGISFSEFYAMFPSIKENLPEDKFKFACSNVLENNSEEINKHLSAENILKLLKRLTLQRKETLNTLNSIDYRIQCIKLQINETIKNLQTDICNKKIEIEELKREINPTNEHQNNIKLKRLIYKLETDITILKRSIKELEKYKNYEIKNKCDLGRISQERNG